MNNRAMWQYAILLIGPLFFSTSSLAQCVPSFPAGGGSFGSVSSFQAQSSPQATSVNLTLKCDLVLATLLSSDNVSLTFSNASNLAGNSATLKVLGSSGSDNIPINICTTSNCASPITQGNTDVFSSSTLATLLSASTFTIPLYFRTTTGQSIAAGQYTVTLNLTVAWDICGLVGIGGLCTNKQQGSTLLSTTLTLDITNDCITISAPNVNFGDAPFVSSLGAISQTIAVTCTKGSTYSVGINDGLHAVNGVRYLSNGTNSIAYDIYQGTTAVTRWGSVGAQRWASGNATSVSGDQLTRNYTYLAQILSGQSTDSSGLYTDTLVVDIAF